MKIEKLRLIERDGKRELSAEIDSFHLWFRFPLDVAVMESMEPFLASGYLAAIAQGGELSIAREFPISTTLHKNLSELQRIYRCWNYDFRAVTINGTTAPPAEPMPGVATMYSAGVDSMYTLLSHQEEITHMIRIFGYDFLDTPENIERIVETDRAFAVEMGKKYIPIESNFRKFTEVRKQDWVASYAFGLYATTLALGIERCYYPSSHTFTDLFPDSSHPLTDPLWSNGQTQIVHDSAIRRSEKIRHIVKFPRAFEQIHVCWRYPLENCGSCSKCLRTMLTLRILGENSNKFPSISLKEIKKIRANSISDLTFLEDNLLLSEEMQEWNMFRIIKRIIHRYQLSVMASQIDGIFLFGGLRRLYRWKSNPDWLNTITLEPKERKY